ncbi:MAG: hypothetical protein RBT11_00520 [Desulfobacterales bacterium]|jgi:hypothetical protein|nr:hypothetical protein [Desulfobacterales bacterium]
MSPKNSPLLTWDKHIDPAYLAQLLEGKAERHPGDKNELYRKLLTGCDWYTLLRLIPADRLKTEVLSEEVLSGLFPKALKLRYLYAKEILSR